MSQYHVLQYQSDTKDTRQNGKIKKKAMTAILQHNNTPYYLYLQHRRKSHTQTKEMGENNSYKC